jgi:hypothetical protein
MARVLVAEGRFAVVESGVRPGLVVFLLGIWSGR